MNFTFNTLREYLKPFKTEGFNFEIGAAITPEQPEAFIIRCSHVTPEYAETACKYVSVRSDAPQKAVDNAVEEFKKWVKNGSQKS